MPNRVMFVALVVALAARAAAQTPERYTIAGDDVAVYNLVGQLKVEGGTGAAVLVEVTRHGADAARLKIATAGRCKEIVESDILEHLKVLDLRHGCVGDKGARTLARRNWTGTPATRPATAAPRRGGRAPRGRPRTRPKG